MQTEPPCSHGLNTLEHQPAKLAAIEAIWDTHGRVPLNLFAIPDEKAETDRYVIAIPDLGSLILTHNPNGVVHGLKDWPANERPSPVAVPFFGFRIMVGIAVIMLALIGASLWQRWRGELFDAGWFLWCCTPASPLGLGAGAGALVADRRSNRNRGGEPVDAMGEAADRRAVVLMASYRDFRAGADRDCADRLVGVAVTQQPF